MVSIFDGNESCNIPYGAQVKNRGICIMRSQVMLDQEKWSFQKLDIGPLADFLNIKLGNIDEMSAQEQARLLEQLVALSQLKLTRLTLHL